jgi:hypothetical protein
MQRENKLFLVLFSVQNGESQAQIKGRNKIIEQKQREKEISK